MDLRRYFQPVRGDDLPDPKGPLSATIPQQAIAEAIVSRDFHCISIINGNYKLHGKISYGKSVVNYWKIHQQHRRQPPKALAGQL